MSRSFILIVVGFLLGIGLIAGIVFTRPYVFRGSQIDPPIKAVDFTLSTGENNTFQLSQQQGRIVLIFFGYTTCPDICPATLGEMKQIRQRLGDQADGVKFVFITVDPQRDTPERMTAYVNSFDPSFIGLTGEESDLEPVWKNFMVYRAITQQESAAGYLVDHTSRIFLVDSNGNLRLTYPFGTPVDDILQDLRYLLKQKDA